MTSSGGGSSDGSGSAGGCGHGECAERKEHCGKESCAGSYGFDEVCEGCDGSSGEIKYYRLEERKRSLSISLANKILQSRFRELIIYSKILDSCVCVEWEMEKLRERNSVKEDVGKYLYENAPRYTF